MEVLKRMSAKNPEQKRFSKEKKIISDFTYNILATIIQTAVLQIVVYPFMATVLGAEEYGYLLTIMGIVNIFIVSLGDGLNNVRLIQKNAYEEQKLTGDFNLLLLSFSSASTLVFGIFIAVQFKVTGSSLIFLLLCVLVGIVASYWSVSYRLYINYKMILAYNVARCVGYVVGLLLVKWIQVWPIAFMMGEVFGSAFLLKTTSLYKEKAIKTPLFSKTTKIYLTLIITNLTANVVIYLDRIFLYPVLGGEQVTIYTVSSFVGKSVGMLVTPIASVLLSYYAQKNFKMTIKRYWTINGMVLVGGGVIGAVAVFLAPWITGILYPTVIGNTAKYIVIANVATLIGALTNILSPSVLKFANIFWQIVIQGVYALSYIVLGYLLLQREGLWGFCIATFIVNIIRMLLYMIIGHFSINKNQKLTEEGVSNE